MLAILAEDLSDVETLKEISRRIVPKTMKIQGFGFGGCGGLRRKGASHLLRYQDLGARAYIVCHDADTNKPESVSKAVLNDVVIPSGIAQGLCIVVPVQEIEAWILADTAAIRRAVTRLDIKPHASPQTIDHPKDYLVNLSKQGRGRSIYRPADHNKEVAKYLNFDELNSKCDSFASLYAFLRAVA